MRKLIFTRCEFITLGLLLFVLLFADGVWAMSPGFVGALLAEITDVCRDSSTQWMLVFCLVCYFGMLLVLERRVRPDWIPNCDLAERFAFIRFRRDKCGEEIRSFLRPHIFFSPDLWLAGLVGVTILRYALTYETAVRSLQIPVLIACIVFGKAISLWVRWVDRVTPCAPQAATERSNCTHRVTRPTWILAIVMLLLAASALWQPGTGTSILYYGIHRWSGAWGNPNLYGLLMGVGLVLAICQIAGARGWGGISCVLLCSFTAILCGYGLFKSYSRGAWLAVFVGLIYLAALAVKSSRSSIWVRRNWFPLILIVVSLLLLTFWQFRYTEWHPARRVFSVTNVNDFSWRNRVTAWEGALRMMVDRPFFGFGWGQAETFYTKKYCPPRLNEGAAIEMNDYLMIGISAGIPAIVCFIAYLGLSLRGIKIEVKLPSATPHLPSPIFTTCRAGAIVLLVGFWFDGGLFKLPVAVVFWMLIELARVESYTLLPVSPVQERDYNDARSSLDVVPKRGSRENRLRWLAGILAVLAAAQTTVYLGTPFLPVNDETLVVARKCLIQQNEVKDFEFLSTNAVWRGKKLKGLLEHVRLANYNRQLINWKLDDKMYQDYVLSPVITGDANEQLNWRRPLWEEFYLRIRHESLPEDATKIVMEHLHERVKIVVSPNPPHDVPDIWLKQITNKAGFEIIYVAALRSVGVPARLDSNRYAEFYDGSQWQAAPPPIVINW